GAVMKDSPAEKAGLHTGDKILSINNRPIDHWESIQTTIYFDEIGKDLAMKIERSGNQETLTIPRSMIPDISEESFGLIPSNTEALINNVIHGKPAEKAGFLSNDVIISINGQKVFNQDHVIKIIHANPSKEVTLVIRRDKELRTIPVTPSSEGLIGIGVGARYTGPTLIVKYGLFESFPKGVKQTVGATVLFARSIWQLIVGKADFSKSVGGPIKIAQIATRSAEIGILSFLAFMALLSISLAVMNILPFPALDGGHLIVLIYEAIVRKPLPHLVQIRIQQVGMIILLSFMAFVLYNDIFG
ncbi:MAG: RIP metalloprotease RseP, partial [Bacteroidota bacterium]|nr:RIP metalloprotease RseP [Bacteroidota bacterium]